ncbi:GGDEF domain-containing protein [Tepidimonas charontis]|uniref:diguanylate cyclase n=1 Tax=Tepidimonas charontis TaxID=2267262 RepID=A0A554XKR0_9BURK|nr:diguanylate cyclase [Tepidimonas charontis]TSE36413.1 putative diguanylate cyclase YegE [Tepidimonas charontis]
MSTLLGQLGRHPRMAAIVAATFVVLLALQAALVYVGMARMQAVGAALDEVTDVTVAAERHSREMAAAVQQRILLMLRMLAQPDPLDRSEDAQAFEQQGLAFGRARDAWLALPKPPEIRARFERIQADAVALSRSQRAIVEALIGGQDDQARALFESDRVIERQRELVRALESLAEQHHGMTEAARAEAQATQRSTQTLMIWLGLGLFALGAAIGTLVTWVIHRSEGLLHAERQRMEDSAHTDALTGLLNRRGFEREVQRWRAQGRPGQRHSVLLIDLDHFKPINDTAGHDAGDAALRRVALLLREQTRPVDAVARLGGDEFAVLLRELDQAAALEVGQRIVSALGGFVFDWKGRHFPIGASIGAVAFDADVSSEEWPHVLKRADEACYAAKQAGRGRAVAATESGASATVAAT